MELHLLSFVVFLLFAVLAVSHAALSSKVYWETVLPNTPMPKAIEELLRTDLKRGESTAVNVGKGGVGVDAKIFYMSAATKRGVHVDSKIIYKSAATEDQLQHEDPNAALFFLEKDLLQGSKMKLHFITSTAKANFLPRKLSDAIPFTSDKLTDVMHKFSVEAMKQTVKQCEAPSQEGEERYCATSLESMVDFCVSKLGKQVQPM